LRSFRYWSFYGYGLTSHRLTANYKRQNRQCDGERKLSGGIHSLLLIKKVKRLRPLTLSLVMFLPYLHRLKSEFIERPIFLDRLIYT